LVFSWTCIRTAVPLASKKTVADDGVPHRNGTWMGGATAADVATIPSGKATASSDSGSAARPLLIELFC
jgi:hypothetical protein